MINELILSGGNNDDLKRGGGGDDGYEKSGMGPVYRIGKHKFRLDGKDGKTLDDIIEVQSNPLNGSPHNGSIR